MPNHSVLRNSALRCCFILTTLLISGACAQSNLVEPKAVWGQRLSPDLEPDLKVVRHVDIRVNLQTGVRFLGNDRLMIWSREIHEGKLIPRSAESGDGGKYTIRLSLFETGSGAYVKDAVFPILTKSPDVSVLGEAIVINSWSQFRFLSFDLQQIAVFTAAQGAIESEFRTSPTRKTMLVGSVFNGFSQVLRVDARTLQVTGKWTETPQLLDWSIDDTDLIELRNDGHSFLRSFDQPAAASRLDLDCPGAIGFVAQSITLDECEKGPILRNVGTGETIPLHPGFRATAELIPSTNGDSFAVSLWKSKSRGFDAEPRTVGYEILVYRIRDGQRIFQLNILPLPKMLLSFDLSPDGRWLAVLSDRQLQLYRVS